jgi:hypothetical protein
MPGMTPDQVAATARAFADAHARRGEQV